MSALCEQCKEFNVIEERKINWYQNSFDNLYYLFDSFRQLDTEHKDFSVREQREADFYIDLINKKFESDIKLLEIGVGYGRLVNKIQNEQNKFINDIEYYGLELSEDMLSLASRYLNKENLYKGHMKYVSKIFNGRRFDVIIMAFTTFGYYYDSLDNIITLKAIQQIIADGGIVIIEQYPPVSEYESLKMWSKSISYKEYNEFFGIDRDAIDGNMYHLDKTSELVPINEYETIYRGDYFYYKYKGDEKYLFRRDSYNIHLYTPLWFKENLSKVGFKNIKFHKDWEHSTCSTNEELLNSNVMICVAERK